MIFLISMKLLRDGRHQLPIFYTIIHAVYRLIHKGPSIISKCDIPVFSTVEMIIIYFHVLNVMQEPLIYDHLGSF